MKKKYIADLIPIHEIKTWGIGDKILINAPTGSGKSYFVINILNEYAKDNKSKILFLTNRKILKEQIKSDIGTESNITVLSYQQLTEILKKTKMNINKYLYIVADECHFFYSDSYFNPETDITLEFLTNLPNNIVLFLSATSEVFKEYMANKNIKQYELDNELKYEKLYYFDNQQAVIKILENLPKNEKAIYFCSSIAYAYELYDKFSYKSTFLCSDNNKKYKSIIDKDTRTNIIDNAKFDEQILFTTKILDNGVNIKDEQLKHIIIDIFDFDTIQQCIGRKRTLHENDKVNVYIKRFRQSSIQSYINQWGKLLSIGDAFIKLNQTQYLNEYGRKNTNGLIYNLLQPDGTVKLKLNEALYFKLKNDVNTAIIIKDLNNQLPSKLGHLQILSNRYKIELSKWTNLDTTIVKESFDEQLSRYLNIKMYKEEQQLFKDFINKNAVKTVAKSHGSLGINTINGYFEDNNIMYRVNHGRDYQKPNRGKTYWQLYKLI